MDFVRTHRRASLRSGVRAAGATPIPCEALASPSIATTSPHSRSTITPTTPSAHTPLSNTPPCTSPPSPTTFFYLCKKIHKII